MHIAQQPIRLAQQFTIGATMYIAQKFLNTANLFGLDEADSLFASLEIIYGKFGDQLHYVLFWDRSQALVVVDDQEQLKDAIAFRTGDDNTPTFAFLKQHAAALHGDCWPETAVRIQQLLRKSSGL